MMGPGKAVGSALKIFAVLIAVIFLSSPGLAWWNETWSYRKQINVTDQSGSDLTDYQVAINLSYEPEMMPDFSEIRFTYYNWTDGTETEIPHWIEQKADSSWAYVWVKVPFIPANSNATIYVYFGNTTAVIDKSNSTSVFDLYDDFDDGSIANFWIQYVGGGSITETGGYVEVSNPGGVDRTALVSSVNITTPILITYDYYISVDTNPNAGLSVSQNESTGTTKRVYHLTDTKTYDFYVDSDGDGTYDYQSDYVNISGLTWYRAYVIINSTGTYVGIGSSSDSTTFTFADGTEFKVLLGSFIVSGTTTYSFTVRFDNLTARRYASKEPSYSVYLKESSNLPTEIQILSPSNGQVFVEQNNITFTVNLTEYDSASSTCDLWINDVKKWTVNPNITYTNYSVVPDGDNVFRVNCTDSDGFSSSKSVSFRVETYPQFLGFWEWLESNYEPEGNYSFEVNVSDLGRNIYGNGVTFQLGRPDGSVANYTLPDGLILHFTFDSVNSTNYTYDSSGYGHHGQLKDTNTTGDGAPPVLVPGKFEKGIDFDGDGDLVEVSNSLDMVYENMTVALWVWADDQKQLSFAYHNDIIRKNAAWSISTKSTNSFGISTLIGWDSTGTYAKWDSTWTITLKPYSWNFIVFRVQYNLTSYEANYTLTIYNQDGKFEESRTLSNATIVSKSYGKPVYVAYGSGGWYKGKIDEVMIFNRSLDNNEVNMLYESLYPKFYSGTPDLNGLWYLNFTQDQLGPAGSYNYSWYFTDLSGISNSSSPAIFVVDAKNSELLLESSAGWVISTGTETTITCTAIPELSVTLYKDGVIVPNPYTATLGQGIYEFRCVVNDTANYTPPSQTKYLNVLPGGIGCTNNETFAYRSYVPVSADQVVLNFTELVSNGWVRKDLNDVMVNQTGVSVAKNITSGDYLVLVNSSSSPGGFTIYFGNYYANLSVPSEAVTNSTTTDFQVQQSNDYIYSFTMIDEMSGEEFIPTANRTYIILSCPGGSTFADVNPNDTKITFATTGKLDSASFVVMYSPTEIYYRDIILSSNIESRNIYLVDANNYQVVQMLLQLQDNSLTFSNPKIHLKKQIGDSLEVITEKPFDAENKAIVYLINGQKYQISVTGGPNDSLERVIGYLYVDTVNLIKTIVISPSITYNSSYGNVSYSFGYDNATGTITLVWKDPSALTYSVELYVYNYTDDSLLFYGVSYNKTDTVLTYVVPDPNATYKAVAKIHHAIFGTNTMTITAVFSGIAGLPFTMLPFLNPWLFLFVVSFGLAGIPLFFGPRHGATAGIVVALMALAFAVMGFFPVSIVLLAVVLVLAIINKLKEGERR